MDAATLQAVAALSGVLVAGAGLMSGVFIWLFRDMKQDFKIEVRRLDAKIDRSNAELREDMRQMEERILRGQAELREDMRGSQAELREEMRSSQAELREDMRRMEERLLRGQDEMREEMRRGFAQLLTALNGHTHDPDTGAAVFHEVPTAADDD